MFRTLAFFLAASAVLFFAGPSSAKDGVLLALNTPAPAPVVKVTSGLKEAATVQARLNPAGYTDFDAFSSVDDPLYREGSKELLKKVISEERHAKPALRQELRDAPVSKPVKAIKRVKVRKPVHADPVKGKNAL